MTIKLLTALPFGGYTAPAGATISLDPSAEGGLVASKMAIWSTGTVDWSIQNGAAPTFNVLGDREVEAVQALVSTLGAIRRSARAAWQARVAALMAQHPPVPTHATVKFIDPSVAGPGTGTVADPFKQLPALVTATSYLFIEGSVNTLQGRIDVTVDNVLFGTYGRNSTDAVPVRVFDRARVAALDAGNAQHGIYSSTSKGGWTVSGLKFINIFHATQPEGIRLGAYTTIGTNANCIAEYCVIDNSLSTSGGNGGAIKCHSKNGIVRFNYVRVTNADGITASSIDTASSPGAGENPQIYGNEIEVISSTVNNPDGIQGGSLYNSLVSYRIDCNWVRNSRTNVKQCLVINDFAPGSVLGGSISYNYFEGADVAVLTPPSGATGNQKCMEVGAARLKIWGNVCIGGDYSINLSQVGGYDVRGNIIYQYSSPGQTTFTPVPIGINTVSGLTVACTVEHNTIVLLTQRANSRAISFSGGSLTHAANFNICVGPWLLGIRKNTNSTETNNIIFGATIPVTNSADALTSFGAGTTASIDPQLAEVLQPLNAAVPLASTAGSFVDAYNNPFTLKTGAVQA